MTQAHQWASWIWDRREAAGLLGLREENPEAYRALSRVLGYLRKQSREAPKGHKWPYLAAEQIVAGLRSGFVNPNPYSLRRCSTWDRWYDGVNGSFNSDDED